MEQRLQKIIADAGITSRRKAEQIILEGRVMVNGATVSKLGAKADPEKDQVRVDGRLLTRTTDHVYLLVNKPVGYVSTVKDPEHRPTVMALVKGIRQRVYPVGRLDYHSSGLMILTNDGELANFLMTRGSAIPRTYHVKLEGRPDPEGIVKLQAGIALDGRRTEPCKIRPLGQAEKPWFEITLIEGRYHQVRRMFERIGKGVVKLKRVGIAFLTDERLGPGEVRPLSRGEVERLKNWKSTDVVPVHHKPRPVSPVPISRPRPVSSAPVSRSRRPQAPAKPAWKPKAGSSAPAADFRQKRKASPGASRRDGHRPAGDFRPKRRPSPGASRHDGPRPGNRR